MLILQNDLTADGGLKLLNKNPLKVTHALRYLF
ncbi:hypothetical protein M2403_000107 [Rahnella sp. BIGb0603]|nr:hypothetical protein [Rahnella sp. BIGb0603]